MGLSKNGRRLGRPRKHPRPPEGQATADEFPLAPAGPETPKDFVPPMDFGRPLLSPRDAAIELLRRRRARNSLEEFARAIDIPGAPVGADDATEVFRPIELALAQHHRLMCAAIERTMLTPGGRLIMQAPPGSAKSTYTSVLAPVWALSRTPNTRIILASYAANIAWKQSRKARSLCRSPKQVSIWPDRPYLAADQRAVPQWALTNGSEFMAAGILAGITGNRANGVIGDDMLSGREAADSEIIRQKTFDEFNDSLLTRLLPGGWVILMHTRWHEDDPIGRLLPEDYAGQSGEILCRDGQTWTVLNMPAKAEHEDDPLGRAPGEYLWPEWFPEKHWAQWENNPGAARTWSALFQQRPTAGDGLEFRREWFKWYDPDIEPGKPGGRPALLSHYGASDYATKDDKGDFTEHGVVGIDQVLDWWIVDWWYGQKTTDVSISAWIEMLYRNRPRIWANEGGAIDNAIRPSLDSAMRSAIPPIYTQLEAMPSVKSKVLKAASFQARVAQGKVHLPLKRAWATRLVDQLCAFPAGRYDDAVDVCGLLGRLIDSMMAPYQPAIHERRRGIKPFTAEWLEATEEEPMQARYA